MSDLTTELSENFSKRNSRIFIIGIVLMLPILHILSVIEERRGDEQNAKQELATKWSKEQVAGAVVLSIPMLENFSHQNTLHFLPENLKINADVKNITEKSGIYEVPLYETKISMSGEFRDINAKAIEMVDTTLNWNKANLSLGVLELRGLKSLDIKWNGKAVISKEDTINSKTSFDGLKPSTAHFDFVGGEVIAKITPDKKLKQEGKGKFSIEMVLRGSESIEFYPLAQTTTVVMTSTEETPTFKGLFLPEKHGVKNNKFHAQWKILGINQNLPEYWKGDRSFFGEMKGSKFGLGFNDHGENYPFFASSINYFPLFLALTFITFIFLEVVLKFRFHLVHYAMTGASLVVFYYLLVSFSEQIGFGLAYGLAAVATIFSVSMYVFRITKVRKSTWIVCSQLGLLYSFLYGGLKIEGFQFAFEATGLWIILAALMYATTKIDWFKLSEDQSKKKLTINSPK